MRGHHSGKAEHDGTATLPDPVSKIDLGEFDELDAIEERLKEREGLNMYGKPKPPEPTNAWRDPNGVKPPTPVDSLAESRKAATGRLTSADIGMRWPAPSGLIEAVVARNNTDGPKMLAEEYGVDEYRIWQIAKKCRDHGLLEKAKGGRRPQVDKRTRAAKAAERPEPSPLDESPDTPVLITDLGEQLLSATESHAEQVIELVLRIRIRVDVQPTTSHRPPTNDD